MVHFHTICHMPDASPISLKFISDECDFMAPLNKALSELIAMSFDSSKLWEGEISAYEYTVFSIRPSFLDF